MFLPGLEILHATFAAAMRSSGFAAAIVISG
jgi:hypothetical protein